jgi:proteasome alpha subunit
VTGKSLANAYSQTLGQIFSHEVKPYEVDIVVAELGVDVSSDKLFRVQFDGTLRDAEGFAVLGAGEEAITDSVRESMRSDLSLSEAVRLATTSIEQVEDREIEPAAWETGFLDRAAKRRTFRRLAIEELEDATEH